MLTEAQLAELRSVIEQWTKENPEQYYVSHVRFTDFAAKKGMTADSPQAKAPGSVFGLLYLDPLAGLDPVARELQQYRALTERILYLTNRLPMVLAWRIELAAYRTVNAPQLTRFNDNTSKFTEVATRFTDVVTRFAENVRQMPANLATERTAAIQQLEAVTTRQVQQIEAASTRQVKLAVDQAFAGVTAQREAINRDLEAQTSKARAVIGDVRGVVERRRRGRPLGERRDRPDDRRRRAIDPPDAPLRLRARRRPGAHHAGVAAVLPPGPAPLGAAERGVVGTEPGAGDRRNATLAHPA